MEKLLQDALIETDKPAPAPPSFGLALGGGGARGFAHIAILEALDELGIKPSIMSGTSIGALLGGAYASGVSGLEIRDHCEELFQKRISVVRRLFSHWNDSLFSSKNLMNGSPFSAENIITALIPGTIAATFNDLEIPLLAVATDFYAQSQYVMEKGPLIPAIAASCALPGVFRPVQLNDRVLVDGGFVNVTPFDLLSGRAEVVAGIDVTSGPESREEKFPSLIETIIGSTQITMRSVVNEKLERITPDIFIRADIGQFRVLEFYKFQEIYAASAKTKDEFKYACEKAMAAK